MEPTTAFILGAGFSAEQQFPLVWGLRERVIHFLEAERHVRYLTFIEASDDFPTGQFYDGLAYLDEGGTLGFEELLIALRKHLAEADREDTCHIVDELLRIGAERLLWAIDGFIHRVDPGYEYFARRLLSAKGNWNVVTFNWDLLVERALTEVGAVWSYCCAEGHGKPVVVKPHGSINWNSFAQQKLKAEYSAWKPVSPGSTLSFDSANPLANPDMQEINSDLRWCLYPGDPALPTMHSDIALLWEDARELISSAQRIVFIGYSLPAYDTYAGETLVQLCNGKVTEVYDPSSKTRDRFKSALPHAELHDATFTTSPFAAVPRGLTPR